ncbi:MAG: biopolymer transporter ExbD [Ruminococcus sp.]|nr:biopolymer transporter ExbD [Ruminococcus sp.]
MMRNLKLKGEGSGGTIIIILIIIIIVGVILYLFRGDFNGDKDGGIIPVNATVADAEEETTAKETPTEITNVVIEIVVSGKEYVYSDNTYELDELIAKIKEKIEESNNQYEIHIKPSESSTYNAVDDLTAKLEEEKIKNYSIDEQEESK